MHSENPGKFERPKLFNVGNSREFWDWILQEVWETRDIHIQRIPCEFSKGLFVEIVGSLSLN